MLIRHLTQGDIPRWLDFSHEVSDEVIERLAPNPGQFWEGFDEYMVAKIKKCEAFMAVDRMSDNCLGIIAFSKRYNRITFFGVSKAADFQAVGAQLLEVALNQLDKTNEITVKVINSKTASILNERKIYESFGFIEQEGEVFEAGVAWHVMKRFAPEETKKGSYFLVEP